MLFNTICLGCGEIFTGRKRDAKYCHNRCRPKSRSNHLKRKFNLSVVDYERMFAEQDGRCAICSKPQSALKKRLGVDHNHETGQIRGLLCGICNSIIIRSLESTLLAKAQKYLETYGKGDTK